MQANQKNVKYDGPFISDIVKTIFGRKVLLCIIWALVTITGIIGLQFIVNPSVEKYEVEFTYNYKKLNEGTNYDNSSFNYKKLVNKTNLQKVKNSKSDYDKVNIDKILDKSYISIDVNYTDNNDFDSFVIKSSVKAFPNKYVAKDFLNDLINLPIEDNLNTVKVLSYSSNLNAIENSYYYEMKLSYIYDQFSVINIAYNNLISNFGDVTLDDSSINDYRKNAINYLEQNPIESLIAESSRNGYIDNFANNEDKIVNDLLGKLYNYNLNLNKLESLKDMLAASTVEYNSMEEVRNLVFANEEIKFEIGNYAQKLLANGVTVAELKAYAPEISNIYTDEVLDSMVKVVDQTMLNQFNAKLDSMISQVNEFTKELNEIEDKVLSDELTVNYTNLSIIKTNGGLHIILVIIISFIIGFVCGAIVNIVLDYNKIFVQKEEEKEKMEA